MTTTYAEFKSALISAVEAGLVAVHALTDVQAYLAYHASVGSTPSDATPEVAQAYVSRNIKDFNTVLANVDVFAQADYANFTAQNEVAALLNQSPRTAEEYFTRFDAVSVARKVYGDNILKVYKSLK